MPIYSKPSPNAPLVEGLVCVMTGKGASGGTPAVYDPGMNGSGNYTQRWASGDSLLVFQVLSSRYQVRPSGWSH